MRQSRSKLTRPWILLPLAAAMALSLSACGGGGGGGVGSPTSLSGAVIDAPIANATVTITTGAPLGQSGATTVGTITTDAQGNYTINIALPNAAVPVFASASSPDGQVVLTAYLGSSSAILAAGSLTQTNLPNLVISQVTTAALAAYIASGGSYASLTPTLYATLLSQYHNDILAVSAAIKAVADGYCSRPRQFVDTDDMARAIAQGGMSSTNTTTATLSSAVTTLGSGCDSQTLQNLMQYIASDSNWTPELELGDLIEHGVTAVAPGTYSLQGVIAQSGMSASSLPPASPASSASAPVVAPTSTPPAPAVYYDTVTVDASGNISSPDAAVSGVVVGNLIKLTVNAGSGTTYTFAGKAAVLPTGFVTGGTTSPSAPASAASGSSTGTGSTGYSLRMGGETQSGGMLTRFDAVLAPQGSQPNWAGIPTTAKGEDGLTCASGQFGARLMGAGASVGGMVLGACVQPQSLGLALTPSTGGSSDDAFDSSATVSFNAFTLSTGSGSSTPYVLQAQGPTITTSTSTTSLTGQMYYVMGAKDMIYATPTGNSMFMMNENPLDKMMETGSNGDH